MSKDFNLSDDVYGLSLEQKKIWAQTIQQPNQTAYNISEGFKCSGEINFAALISALKLTLNNTPALSVIFQEKDDGTWQSPAPDVVERAEYITQAEGFPSYNEAQKFVCEKSNTPFDLYKEIPVRMIIARYAHQHSIVALCFHHIAIDGWSAQLFYNDLNANYSKYLDDTESSNDKPAASYFNYLSWQQDAQQKLARQNSHEYWCKYLSDASPILELPMNRKRGGNFNSAGSSMTLPIPEKICQSVKHSSVQHHVTDWCFYLTVFSLLLQRYSNQTLFCIGYPSANRAMPGSEMIGGLFTNTLVLKAEFNPDERFSTLLSRNYDTLLSGYAHDNVQLETVINELNVPRSASCNPLWQVLFAQQDRRGYGLNLTGVSTCQYSMPASNVKLDLSVMIDTDSNGTQGIIEFSDQLFERKEIEVLWRHYLQLLTSFANDVHQPLNAPVLADAEPQPAKKTSSAGKSSYHSLNCWFETIVANYPERIAVECEQASLTYAQLNDKANSLSRELLKQGAKPGELIGLSLKRNEYLIIGIIAILKTGCGYLPLDPTYPLSRIDYILQDTDCRIVVTDNDTAPLLAGKNVRLVDVSGCTNEKKIRTLGEVINDGSSLAYCIYTSGSTGNPKGVLISHTNVMRLFDNTHQWFSFDQYDVWTLFHSYSFDFSVWEIFGALLHGGKLVVVPYEISRSPEDFRKLLKERKVTVLNQTPSAFNQLSLVEMTNFDEDDRLKNLRYVIFGGEALNFATLSGWVSKYGDSKPDLVNMYGITETTVHVTHRKISLDDIINNSASYIGDAIPDLDIAILDSLGRPVPTGMVGEMYISGAGLAIGYLNRDSLNSERFIHISLKGRKKRYYKTGDLAKRRFDGELEYYGRADKQVKIRGHRIELGEIESALIKLPDVSEAVVLAHRDAHGKDKLKAWVSIASKMRCNPLLIKSQLAASLPSYMIPQEIIIIDSIPLTTNGKVNTQALPENSLCTSQTDLMPVKANSLLETKLHSIWCNILGRTQVSIHDNFFALGGDSLLAVMFSQQCRKNNITLNVIDLLNHQTIAELAMFGESEDFDSPLNKNAVTEHENVEGNKSAPPDGIYPMSGMQQVMFENYNKVSARCSGAYHVQQSYRMTDENPQPQAMLKAIKMIMESHPVLRTVALHDDVNGWSQMFADDIPVDFKFHDLTKLNGSDIDNKISAIREQDLEMPFTYNVSRKALFRCNWFQISVNRFELLLSSHHGIADGWGNQVLLTELFDLYRAIRKGEDSQPDIRPNVFLEYLALEKNNAADRAHKHFWLPFRKTNQDAKSNTYASYDGLANPRIDRFVDSTLMARLEKIARKNNVTLKSLILYALNSALLNTECNYDKVIGVVSNGRKDNLSDPLRSLGLYWNMLPVRFKNLPTMASLKRVHDDLLACEQFGVYPIAFHDSYIKPCVTFNFVNFHNKFDFGTHSGMELISEYWHDRFHYPLNVYVAGGNNRDENLFRIESSAGYISFQQANALMSDFISCLSDISINPLWKTDQHVLSD